MDAADQNQDMRRPLLAVEQAAVLGQLAEGVILADSEGRITYVNEAAARLHGVSKFDVRPEDYASAYRLSIEDGKPFAPRELALARAVLRGETITGARWRVRRADGSEVCAYGTASPIRDRDGRQIGAVLTMHDDTARVQAEAALREETQALETLNRIGAAVASELELERIVQMVTDAGVTLTGASMGAFFYTVTDAAGQSMLLYALSGADRGVFAHYPMPRRSALFQPTLAGESAIRLDDVLQDPRYGKTPPYHGLPPGHPPVRSYLAVPVISRSGRVLGGLFFGHPQPRRFTARHERVIAGVAAHAAIAIDNAHLFGLAQREIAERREAEERLRELNETLEQRVEARTRERDRAWKYSSDLQAVVDGHGRILQASDAWTSILGWQPHEVVGRRSYEFVHPDDRPADDDRPFFANLDKGPAFECRCLRKDDGYRWISWVVSEDDGTVYASGRDVTVEKEQEQALAAAEEALRQSQKMEAIGHLTGGIAHDFNNMLAVVVGSLDLLQRRLGDRPERRHAENAIEAANRAAALTRRLLAFARQQPLSPQPVDVNALVAGMSELLRRAIGADVRLETLLAGDVWPTRADPHQLENVILNLAVNARDAMAAGGRLVIETGNTRLDSRYASAHPGTAAGDYVQVTVSDSGVGMPPEVVACAFDPFFTTKPTGHGTGLGLSQVYGFVKQSGGHVKLYSEPGRGTSVKVYLPRLTGSTQAVSAGTDAAPPPPGRQELVLLVDDESAVREVSAEALRELGYRVLEADGAEAALALLDAHPDIALLFTDMVMPDVDGRQLAAEARRRRPGLKVLFATGYSPKAARAASLGQQVQLLGKPYTLEELGHKLRQVLEGS